MKITPKNWGDFQHYKQRRPPWIRLYRSLLDDFDFQCLPDASRALAPMLWLLASEYQSGIIETTLEKLAFRFRRNEDQIKLALIPLIDAGFFVCDCILLANGKHHDSSMLASRQHGDSEMLSQSREEESEERTEGRYGLER